MSGPFRLNAGGQIDRSRPLRFTFGKQQLTGFDGDTLASALLGAGVSVVGRGFKFHRPRGVLTAGVEEPNALLTVGSGARREPSVRATVQPLFEGLAAEPQNCWPSLSFDMGRLHDFVYPLFPAGFYNKTFLWPGWHTFEPLIRRLAGLGNAAELPDPDRYEWRNTHCDVLVIGGGAAGMLAAFLAGSSGARVFLVESDKQLGGGLNWDRAMQASSVLPAAIEKLSSLANVRVLVRTTAVGAYDHGVVTAVESSAGAPDSPARWRQRWWRIRARHIVLASGAFEQPLAFPFNDRPGIMLADAVRHYLNRYGVAAGQRVALATNNDTAYQVALDLHAAGVSVPCVLDTRADPQAPLVETVASKGIQVHGDVRIVGTRGGSRIESLEFVTNASARESSPIRIDCDSLGMSGGWNPVAHLHCQAGGRLRWDAHHACLTPDSDLASVHPVGAAAAQFDIQTAARHARTAVERLLESVGRTMCTDPGFDFDGVSQAPVRSPTGSLGYRHDLHRDRTWIDFQHDVTVSDIDLAVRENLVSVEHVKRYTTVGMSVDQGKTSNLNALDVLAEKTGRSIQQVGTTTFRPMFTPVTLGAIAGGRNGEFYRPRRLLPAHDRHSRLGAHFEDYGAWLRPAHYPTEGESEHSAVHREVHTVRERVGLFDGSPLGKFLVRGPDAAEFLNRMYANTIHTLQPGHVRYGVMLNEQGIIIDDGVCARLSGGEFWVNTTGSGAAHISAWFAEWLQGEWQNLQVVVTDLTTAWATLSLAGPRARDVLASLPSDIDLRREMFPHMHIRSGTLCGVPCRILRVSFTGELSYEISVPADYASALWDRLLAAGQEHGIGPVGVEAVLVMRTEKGNLHVGADTDGNTVPADIGLGTATARKSADFIGRRSLAVPEHVRTDRMQIVGLRCLDSAEAFVAGAHLLDSPRTQGAQPTAGYLTSAVASPTLNAHVGLGLLRNGRARMGETVFVMDGEKQCRAQVVSPSHYDPRGARLNA